MSRLGIEPRTYGLQSDTPARVKTSESGTCRQLPGPPESQTFQEHPKGLQCNGGAAPRRVQAVGRVGAPVRSLSERR